jgi:23S rRNA (adenine2503-C2)-methyltransferase
MYRKAATTFSEMSDLPAQLREDLASRFTVGPLQVLRQQESADGVQKLLVHGGDGQGFECVLLPYRSRVSCCISSQVGCALGCRFCATGLGGFDRNLTPGEIVGQYLLLQTLTTRRISHVVYMGMGEPLHNYDSVVASLRLFHEEVGISYRRLTVSTVGIVPEMHRLAEEGLPIHLAVSLHSPLDDVRSKLMPVNRRWPIAELISACRAFVASSGRKITFEYLLIDEVTDTEDQAVALAKLIKGLPCLVNLIPFNYVDTEQGFRRPSRNRVRHFRSILEAAGVNVSQRMERGHDIAAACGQLAGQHAGQFAKRRSTCTVSSLS